MNLISVQRFFLVACPLVFDTLGVLIVVQEAVQEAARNATCRCRWRCRNGKTKIRRETQQTQMQTRTRVHTYGGIDQMGVGAANLSHPADDSGSIVASRVISNICTTQEMLAARRNGHLTRYAQARPPRGFPEFSNLLLHSLSLSPPTSLTCLASFHG